MNEYNFWVNIKSCFDFERIECDLILKNELISILETIEITKEFVCLFVCLFDFKEWNKKAQIKVQIDFDGDDLVVRGNKAQLYRSIKNLLENAEKYNTDVAPEVGITLSKINSGISLRVTDNGPGIPDAFKSKIFDAFYRIPTGNIHDVKGYGLGLNYVQKVISQHRGSISVVDNKPSGAIFSIFLPA